MRVSTLALVGVGLIGGSVGLAARRRGVGTRVVGFDRDRAALEQALARGILDEAAPDLAAAARAADLVVFCTPVDTIAAHVLAAAPACRPGSVLTDVGSTKAAIVRDLQGRLPAGVAFVGSHPLAGSEKNGPAFARADLFDDRLVVVTPMAPVDDRALSRVTAFWHSLGAAVRAMGPEEHDRALALTSHLPHLLASALAGVLPPEWAELTATGFRDTTRLAAGDPALWAAIFRSNQGSVLAALERLDGWLSRFRCALADGDTAALVELLRQGKAARDGLVP
jgi:prephenate dehydrogenase